MPSDGFVYQISFQARKQCWLLTRQTKEVTFRRRRFLGWCLRDWVYLPIGLPCGIEICVSSSFIACERELFTRKHLNCSHLIWILNVIRRHCSPSSCSITFIRPDGFKVNSTNPHLHWKLSKAWKLKAHSNAPPSWIKAFRRNFAPFSRFQWNPTS